ncbi:unnamed protein product [Paramecium primaurelia]|uniref:Transmembrane protein n=1 Tax=Paramecium primaurelia TaxID=5886 RepID=A0A8S1PIH8_PARPR|nr:unnamed protein product [Paramecium primaurelia]
MDNEENEQQDLSVGVLQIMHLFAIYTIIYQFQFLFYLQFITNQIRKILDSDPKSQQYQEIYKVKLVIFVQLDLKADINNKKELQRYDNNILLWLLIELSLILLWYFH